MKNTNEWKQLLTYFILAYTISWVIWLPLYGHIFGLNGLPEWPFHHGTGALGPLIASCLTTYIYSGKSGVYAMLKSCFRIRPVVYLLIALFGPFILVIIASLVSCMFDQTLPDLNGLLSAREFPGFGLPEFFLYNFIFFGFGEEAGWRGFALPRLQVKFNALTASMLLTVLWALWHWPLFFYRPGYTGMSSAGIAGWFFSLLTGSVLLTWLYNSSKASILICAVFHSTIDIAFTADLANVNITNYMGILITLWGVLTILVFKPKNLSVKQRETYPGSNG